MKIKIYSISYDDSDESRVVKPLRSSTHYVSVMRGGRSPIWSMGTLGERENECHALAHALKHHVFVFPNVLTTKMLSRTVI